MMSDKTKRSLRRFHRRVASYRRDWVRRIQQATAAMTAPQELAAVRIPTRQELRIAAAYAGDLRDTNLK